MALLLKSILIMRIKAPFAQERETAIFDYRKKYFIASEGAATEPKYFEKLNDSIIKENVSVINILRDYAYQGYSNPTHVVKLLQTFIANSFEGITVQELKNKLANWAHENPNKINLDSILTKINQIYKSENSRIPYDNLENLFMLLFREEVYEDVIKNFAKYVMAQDVTYSPVRDTLNMVIDRDKDSFSNEQYDNVVKFCNDNNVNIYVSNPCFELWLLMHFDEFDKENKADLFLNKKVNASGKRYLEKRLNEICRFKKNCIDFSKFEHGIKKAIEREKDLTEDITKIKYELGTNVGILVNNILTDED